MTRNQLQYWADQETARANRAREQQSTRELGETIRHNVATEATQRYHETEVARHNVVSESQNATDVETRRKQAGAANRTATANWMNANTQRVKASAEIGLRQQEMNEMINNNYVQNTEINRHNLETEKQQAYRDQALKDHYERADVAAGFGAAFKGLEVAGKTGILSGGSTTPFAFELSPMIPFN